ncbi:MauE/DoxX family redox-associated membrane protein [Megalodesulfovibrio gigas]|uniref:Putative DoxX family protein n=1 Tax=Megalodesulfovibrio gigas (strain ATCC 19364 / DSM 1382 / NCIMB 9332 / VKM B-1759) TaxID=1121448 RepID=T2GAR8_MEGG1|nr:MauE/DoxX family redox-associated membrane protein [Megalodesulfovibrio gigas]AGW13216.1 putative DoxX family protein [Megalodesulfovibrio gigas DSM 1382 = ATCC 19364]
MTAQAARRIAGWAARGCHPLPALLMRLYLSGLFLYASVYKIIYAAEFAESIASYQLVPALLVNPVAVIMPWVELVAGLMLLVGLRPKAATLVIGGLLALFTLAIAITLVRGVPIGCGCFKSLEEPMSVATLLRDLGWLAMAAYVWKCDRWLHLDALFFPPMRELTDA